jgi:serine/threonine protein kinase
LLTRRRRRRRWTLSPAEYDARLVDVWACAIVFYCMQLQELPWGLARKTDRTFMTYVGAYLDAEHSHTIPAPINQLPKETRHVIKHMLDPDPATRWSVEECLKDKWVQTIAQPDGTNAAPSIREKPLAKSPAVTPA